MGQFAQPKKNWLFLKLLKQLHIILFLLVNAIFCHAQLQVTYNGNIIKEFATSLSYTMVYTVATSEEKINNLPNTEWTLWKNSNYRSPNQILHLYGISIRFFGLKRKWHAQIGKTFVCKDHYICSYIISTFNGKYKICNRDGS